jgi:signal transduction histidine kinase
MTESLRFRLVLTFAPLLLILALLGGGAVWLLFGLSDRIDAILRENYDSVIYMERLNEALERIDSSFQFALQPEWEEKARHQYQENWKLYEIALEGERRNITLPGEAEMVGRLDKLTRRYRQQGDAFFKLSLDARRRAYDDPEGLLKVFERIKKVSAEILHINQENMEEESRAARRTAADSLVWFGSGLAAAILGSGWLAWRTGRKFLGSIQALTQSAQAIGAGNLDQVVPTLSRDELGQLARAFNDMARQLRELRRSNYAQLLRAQRTSQATIDSFPDPVLVVNPEGGVDMANPAARRLFGMPGGHVGAIPWQAPAPLQPPLAEALQHQQPYLPERFDQAVPLRVDGEERVFLPRLLPIRDPYGNTLGVAVLLVDVTRFRLLDQVKSNLIATVSHELKTPLTGIRLAVHLLLEEVVGPLTAKQTELLVDARDNAERLLGRINDLLDLARLEQGQEQLQRRPEAPADLLRAAAEAIRPRADDKELTLTVEAPADLPPVDVDAPRLQHALDNLLENAVTYTPRGGHIKLSATAANGAVTLAVADTGIGIPPEHLPNVFDRFFRVPGQSQGSGTGLGLAIVREIVTVHGGSVSCTSQPGAGTVFRLTLPACKQTR